MQPELRMTSSSTPSVGRRSTAHLRCYAREDGWSPCRRHLPAGKADEYGVTAMFFIVTPNRDQLQSWPHYSTAAS